MHRGPNLGYKCSGAMGLVSVFRRLFENQTDKPLGSNLEHQVQHGPPQPC